jgi:hypothetical protein
MPKKPEQAPPGPIGRFLPCPVNGDAHPERLAVEIKRTWDKSGKERFHIYCPLCHTRVFVNNWKPSPRTRTIVMAEAEGLHPVGITPERRDELLRELGLVRVQSPQPPPPGQAPWPPQAPPPIPQGYTPMPKTPPSRRKKA